MIDMADEIKTLEYATERSIRTILRGVMRDITSIDEFDYAVSRIERVGHIRIHDAIAKVYLAGYNAAGRLVRKHFVTAAVRQVTDPFGDVPEIEDPLIVKHTTQMLAGVSEMASAQRDDVMAALNMYYEKGYTAERIARALETFFDDDPTSARRFARTATNSIYNRAHLNRYQDSGVVDGVEFSAHLDNRTSDICRMLDNTIWDVNSNEIKMPPRHFNCYDQETDVLTIHGFKPFVKLDGTEYLYTLNPLTTEIEAMLPDRIIKYHYNGDMIHLKSRNYDLLVTPDHSIPYYSKWDWGTGRHIMRFRTAESIGTSDRIPLTGIWRGRTEKKIVVGESAYDPEAFMRFMGWYISEGNVIKNNGHSKIVISQSTEKNAEHVDEIEHVANTLGFEPRVWKTTIGMTIDTSLW